ncbi:MAG: LysM peptidoglycan-binding domain-containing protein [Bacteroidales bacterium]|nr:LysM peptidoglycan-binding domain-containing protein [Bacteroidales bacterium]
MKKIIGLTAIIQLILLISLPVSAQFQPTEVIRSQERTMINGKVYYIHTVQKGQTLYSICRVYGVTQEDVIRENPEIDPVSLKEGLAIRIPESKPKTVAVYPENREDFYAHTVKRGQTVYSLARKYKVTEEVIYHYNPWAREGIRDDQTIWIPRKKEMLDISEEARSSDLFFYYTVKEKDTLYSIALLYGVEIPDIINANPELREGLKAGQVLKIPRIKAPEPDLDAVADSLDSIALPCQPLDQQVVYNVALMLPFFAEFNMEEITLPTDTMVEEGTYVPAVRQQGLRGRAFAEFYEGFMLALDSLRETGFSVNLHVKDTERDTVKIKKIVRELSVLQPDLIIGPVYTEDVNIAGRFARYQEISLVSPLSTRHRLVAGNSNILQVIPSRQAESLALARYIRSSARGQLILVRGTDSASMSNSWIFKKYILESMAPDSMTQPFIFKDYNLNDSLFRVLGKVLSRDLENYIVVFSDDEPVVSQFITRLQSISSLYPVKLYGMPTWQTWKSIDLLNYFHHLQVNLITPFYIDNNDPKIRRFLSRSREVFGYEPYDVTPLGYSYSMLGYDIGLYFLSALRQYGKSFLPCLDQVSADQLMTRFRFAREGAGGYMNSNFVLIQYKNDFTVEKVTLIDSAPAY